MSLQDGLNALQEQRYSEAVQFLETYFNEETAEVIQRVCREKRISPLRLGIIDDQNPTAFTYGSLPNSARLVVSQGLFTYLDNDEVATVYTHELGHIAHWDFAVMTVVSTLVQITYLVYIFTREIGNKGGRDNKLKDALGIAAIAAYIFYLIGTYLLLYLSCTREYYADHFAAEIAGNPNGLSRALVMYPNYQRATESDIFTLMCDAYASPLRGIAPWLDLIQLKTEAKTISSYPRIGSLILGFGSIILGITIVIFMPQSS